MWPTISEALRTQIHERANGCCEYCQTQVEIVVKLEIDHVVPEVAGGETSLDNLCLACASCNGYKADFQEGRDPETDTTLALFNPRHQIWSEHFKWSEDGTQMIGLAPIGRATVERLRMNNPNEVISRRRWVQAGWHTLK